VSGSTLRDLVFFLAVLPGILGVALVWAAAQALVSGRFGGFAKAFLVTLVGIGVALFGTAFYIASWGFEIPPGR
jgi:hypothetical protein